MRSSGQVRQFLFVTVSFLLLAIALVSIGRSRLRPAGQFKWEEKGGEIVVTEVFPGGVAQAAGLIRGDRLLRIDRLPLGHGRDVEFSLLRLERGQRIPFLVLRQGEEHVFWLTLAPKFGMRFLGFNFLLGILFWAIAAFVYLKKPDDKAARVFSWGSIAIAFAIIMIWSGYPYDGKFVGYLLPATFFFVYPLTPAFVLNFMLVYPKEKRILQRHPRLSVLLFAPSLAFVVLLGASYFSAILLNSPARYRSYCHIYTAFRAYFIVYLALSIACLIESYRSSRTRESRNKIQWILWGTCVGAAPFFLLWTFPQILGLSPLVPEVVSYAFLMLIPLAFAISIVKYRALDIEIIISRGIVYVLVTGSIVGSYLVIVGLAGHFLQAMSPGTSSFLTIIFTLLAAVLFAPIRQRIQTFVDRTFYRVKYNYRSAIRNFGKALALARDQSEVVGLLLKSIDAAIPLEKAALLLEDRAKGIFMVTGKFGMSEEEEARLVAERDGHIVAMAKQRKAPLVRRDRTYLSDAGELPHDPALEAIDIELIFPIAIQEVLVGFLVLGRKMSGSRFTDEDLELLIPMAEEAMMALERLRLQEEMILERTAKEKMEELSQLKSEFVSHVSHELRTPLTSIRWSAQNLLDGIPEKPGPRAMEYLSVIYENSRHLGRMIENLLDVTRIEAGRIEISPQRLSLVEEIGKSLEVQRPLAEKKGIDLRMVVPEELLVNADRDYLQAILTNLLDNAVKYSPSGKAVEIYAAMATDEEKRAARGVEGELAAIHVIDHGPGIPMDKQGVIFERFERVRAEKGQREKGLGLGLHIVKKLVELQGGRIWIESEVGAGSTFTFVLPSHAEGGT